MNEERRASQSVEPSSIPKQNTTIKATVVIMIASTMSRVVMSWMAHQKRLCIYLFATIKGALRISYAITLPLSTDLSTLQRHAKLCMSMATILLSVGLLAAFLAGFTTCYLLYRPKAGNLIASKHAFQGLKPTSTRIISPSKKVELNIETQ
jgi:hypothetical protein